MTGLNKPTAGQRAHASALMDWLSMGSEKHFVLCKAYADAGVAPMTIFVTNYASLGLTHRSWADEWSDATAALLAHYVDRGIVKLAEPLHVVLEGCTHWEHNGHLPLEIAMICRQARAAEVLIAKGALQVTDFRGQPLPKSASQASTQQDQAPAGESRDEAFERWLVGRWPSRPDVRTRLTSAAMQARISGAVAAAALPPEVDGARAAETTRRRRAM